MKISINRQRLIFYLWTGLGYFLLWLFQDLVSFPDNFLARILNNIWRTIFVVIINFIFFEYTWAFVKRKRKYLISNILLFLVAFWIQLMLCSFGMYAWRHIGIQFHIYTALKTFATWQEGVTANFSYAFGSLFFFGILRHIYDYTKLKQTAQQLRFEKQQAELNYLKSQTNPHFLFNTLNNIYSLTRIKSDQAPDSILRLSKILRFMIYETSGDFIAIEQELKILSDYIDLEKLRYDNSLIVTLNYDIENPKQSIPPLLLIPLVENAFKHGVSETRGAPFVDIHLTIKQKRLSFIVKNSSELSSEDKKIKENIGLSNIRRQLQLLYTDYDFSVKQEDSVFTAILKINLMSYVADLKKTEFIK